MNILILDGDTVFVHRNRISLCDLCVKTWAFMVISEWNKSDPWLKPKPNQIYEVVSKQTSLISGDWYMLLNWWDNTQPWTHVAEFMGQYSPMNPRCWIDESIFSDDPTLLHWWVNTESTTMARRVHRILWYPTSSVLVLYLRDNS